MPTEPRRGWKIIDTNVSLFQWPFRRLPLDEIDALVEKLSSLAIAQAWAGSFEGLLHRDVAGVNDRLTTACRERGAGRLIPFGSVNLTLPDWEQDVHRCHEQYQMPGIRLHPNYHAYTLEDARFERLLRMAAERSLLVQLVSTMEDRRTQHPRLRVPDVDLLPLVDLMTQVPGSRVLILNYRPTGPVFNQLAQIPEVYFDVARVEATDGVARLVRSVPADRVVFGTHAPLLIYESALIRVYESDLNEVENRALFQQNAQRLMST